VFLSGHKRQRPLVLGYLLNLLTEFLISRFTFLFSGLKFSVFFFTDPGRSRFRKTLLLELLINMAIYNQQYSTYWKTGLKAIVYSRLFSLYKSPPIRLVYSFSRVTWSHHFWFLCFARRTIDAITIYEIQPRQYVTGPIISVVPVCE